jgi:heptosyltransferase II
MLAELKSIDSLVVRCPNWVGDIVMATPVFECLRENFPSAKITACIRPYARGILEDSPWFDHIIDCSDKSLSGLLKIRQEMMPLQPQLGLLLTNTTHSWLTFKLAAVPRVFGYRRNLRKYFLDGGPQPLMDKGQYKSMPMQDYYMELCRYMGLTFPKSPRCKLYISDSLAERGALRLRNYGVQDSDTLIGLNPGASFGSSKCWPANYFARLAELLQREYGCKIVLLVGPGEEEIAASIVTESTAEIINTSSDRIDLAELKPLISRCDLLITNDTGPRHYAVAFGIPNIVLMGPTNPLYTASNLEHTTVIRRDLPCSPCHRKVCPYGHHACMNEIRPEMVMAEVRAVLPRRLQ